MHDGGGRCAEIKMVCMPCDVVGGQAMMEIEWRVSLKFCVGPSVCLEWARREGDYGASYYI